MNFTIKNTLLLLGSIMTFSSWAGQINVNNGATLRGTGTINGDVQVYNGGAVQPQNGCLAVDNATFVAGSTLSVPIRGNTPCAGYGQLQVNGIVDLGEATLDAYTDGYTLQVLDEYVFIDNDAADGITSPFGGLGEEGAYLIDGETLYASYFSGDGNDFSLVYKFIYAIGGEVTGLASGNSVFLQNGSGEIIEVTGNGPYTFNDALDDGSTYNVVVTVQPTTPNQTCTVSNGSGSVSGGPVTNIDVNCVTNTYSIGGTVLGLAAANQVLLQNNSANDLLLGANGAFNFPTAITDGSGYSVTVAGDPTAPNQTCGVINGSGTVNGSNINNVVIECVTNTYTIGGSVSGLAAGNSVTLQNNSGDDLTVSTDGNFTFSTALEDQSAYAVTVLTQPASPNQTCVISNDSGTLAGANVTDVSVTCTTNTYSIGGVVSGLAAGNSVALQNNGGDELLVAGNGAFTFVTQITDETNFLVTVSVQPTAPNQTCVVAGDSGTVSGSDVSDVVVICTTEQYTIGGSLTGLAVGNEVVLQNNSGDDLTVAANGNFTFATALDDESTFAVSVLTQPDTPKQTCVLSNDSGTLVGANITTVTVTCTTNTYTIGGTVSGLAAGNSVVLQNNGADDLFVAVDGNFTFVTALDDESAYAVSVLTQPDTPEQSCEIINDSGTLTGADIIDVNITCTTNEYTVGGTVVGLAAGNEVLLQNNAGDDLTVSADGPFTFTTALLDESGYVVTVLNQPTTPSQTCVVTNDTGTLAGSDVTNVLVNCGVDDFMVGGTLSGLTVGNNVTLQNNGGDDLNLNANGAFVFDTALPDKTTYDVTVLSQPTAPNQMCVISNGSGTLTGDDVIDVVALCTTVQYFVGGTLSGLISGEAVTLQINGGEEITLTNNGLFAFPTGLDDGSAHDVEVTAAPTGPIQNCVVSMGDGTINGEDIITVDVFCDNFDLIFRNGFE